MFLTLCVSLVQLLRGVFSGMRTVEARFSDVRRQEFFRRWTVSLELSASYIT